MDNKKTNSINPNYTTENGIFSGRYSKDEHRFLVEQSMLNSTAKNNLDHLIISPQPKPLPHAA